MSTHMEPPEFLSAAAAHVRSFSHASRSTGDGWQYPGDTYRALGELSYLVGMLPQAIGQATAPATRTYQAGRLRVDGDGDPEERMVELTEATARAVAAATQLLAAVSLMHEASGPMATYLDEDAGAP